MADTTRTGFINRNDQEVLGPTALPGTDHGQRVYVLRCRRCSETYGANGTDIAIRRCPSCDGGRPGFAVEATDIVEIAERTKSRRNPVWTRDELILALDVYFETASPDQSHPAVIELSTLLNRLWARTEFAGAPTLRNPSGVSMKLSNFQPFDPSYQGRGLAGLTNGGRGDKAVWDEFADDRVKLKATASAIREAVIADEPSAPHLDSFLDAEAAEGALLSRLHHYRERDVGLARKRKAQALATTGKLVCEACDFDFAKAYGGRGEGYIEVHHTRPLETLQPGARTKISELALLCANCHRMIHARRPWLTMEQLKELVQERRASPPLSD